MMYGSRSVELHARPPRRLTWQAHCNVNGCIQFK